MRIFVQSLSTSGQRARILCIHLIARIGKRRKSPASSVTSGLRRMAYVAQRSIMTVPVRSAGHPPQQTSMRLPFALCALDWIAPRDVQGARFVLDIDGHPGWSCPAAGGYCVATAVDPPARHSLHAPERPDDVEDSARSRWLARCSLVLAGQSALRDDSLCIANDIVWWVHRFDAHAAPAQVEAQLRRQLLAGEMLTSQMFSSQYAPMQNTSVDPTAPRATHGTRLASTAAGVARRLQVVRHG